MKVKYPVSLHVGEDYVAIYDADLNTVISEGFNKVDLIAEIVELLNDNYSNKGHFKITSVHRDDIESQYDNDIESDKMLNPDVTDAQMQFLADSMENAYVENSFWIDLKIIIEERYPEILIEKEFCCQDCSNFFTNQEDLDEHNKQFHEGVE